MLDNIQTATASQASDKPQNTVNKSQKNNDIFDFNDVLDVINPLQHIPIVSNLYKEQTNDEISNQAKSVGDVLYGMLTGGIYGAFSAIGNSVLKQETTKDLSEHLMAFVAEENTQKNTTAQIKSNKINEINEINESNTIAYASENFEEDELFNNDITLQQPITNRATQTEPDQPENNKENNTIAHVVDNFENDELFDNDITVQQHQSNKYAQLEPNSQKDDFWSARMKQIYGDDNWG